jgi:hypothetical protein
MAETDFVCGGTGECTPENTGGSGNDIAGVSNSSSFGEDLINIYEGAVAAASHVIERVANAL